MAYVYYPAVTVQPVTSAVTVIPATTYVSTSYVIPSTPTYYYCYPLQCCKCARLSRAEANKARARSASAARKDRRKERDGQSWEQQSRRYSIECAGVVKPERSGKGNGRTSREKRSPGRRHQQASEEEKVVYRKEWKGYEDEGDDDEWHLDGKIRLQGTLEL
ncbi:hypothetical protein CSUI_005715 [Cystoisospora suis]|uniref:Uncharacterized protein n=1 Tax=Cystoisospora suis TaxID=483139 RepID=A0A2C6KWL5_9APIC|nr:hypothetical protein CSUI_005715 [Cystoisospora suis]